MPEACCGPRDLGVAQRGDQGGRAPLRDLWRPCGQTHLSLRGVGLMPQIAPHDASAHASLSDEKHDETERVGSK